MKKERYKRAPHYFLVHFIETFTSVGKHPDTFGKPYPMKCDKVVMNVYGLKSEEEAKSFDRIQLRRYLIGANERKFLFAAHTRRQLMKKINNLPEMISGVYTLNEDALYGAIEDIPSCKRMFKNSTGELFCGCPSNVFMNDNSIGGCIISGYQQDEEVLESYGCPLLKYYENRVRKPKAKAV